jgi:hypothetical protein
MQTGRSNAFCPDRSVLHKLPHRHFLLRGKAGEDVTLVISRNLFRRSDCGVGQWNKREHFAVPDASDPNALFEGLKFQCPCDGTNYLPSPFVIFSGGGIDRRSGPMEEHYAGHRLVTQNFITAAARCEEDAPMTWSMLEQLSVLIDLVCLYDQVNFVGQRAFNRVEDIPFGPYVVCPSAFNVRVFNPGNIDSAASRLANYLRDPAGPERYTPLLYDILNLGNQDRSYNPDPGQIQELALGELWLRTLPDRSDPVGALRSDENVFRSVTFFLRTFLYLAFAEQSQIPFTPDSARGSFLPALVENERMLRRRIMTVLKESVEETAIIGDLHVVRATTPLATRVYAEAANRREIWTVAAQLREDLWSLRANIRAAEDDLFWAKQQEQARAAAKWEHVFGELKLRYGKGQGYVTADGLVGFAEKALDVVHDHSQWPKLGTVLVEPLKRMLTRRPIIELYKLVEDAPGTAQTERDIKRLFGAIKADQAAGPPAGFQ